MPRLILLAGLATSVAVASIFIRGIFTTGDNAIVRRSRFRMSNLTIERFSFSVGLDRQCLELNTVIILGRRRFILVGRFGVNTHLEIAVLLVLLLLRSQSWPIFLPLLDDIEDASVFYLEMQRCPRFTCRIVDVRMDQ